jgi:hypothetical protein
MEDRRLTEAAVEGYSDNSKSILKALRKWNGISRKFNPHKKMEDVVP